MSKKSMDFHEARKFSRSLGLKSYLQWRKYLLFKKLSDNYNEPRGMNGFCTLEEAKRFSKLNKIRSKTHWIDFCKKNKHFPNNVPKNPRTVYKREWKGWRDFLGK